MAGASTYTLAILAFMRERLFRFKQFSVRHSESAMKVGTDGVTLGAWASVREGDRVLDAGCGCGLIGLMMAQRGAGEITLLDIDEPSVREAELNAAESSWADRVEVVHADFLKYASAQKFDRVVSNPPFFNNGALAPNQERAMARHELGMSVEALIQHAADMLTPAGTLSLIMPPDREADARFAANLAGMTCCRSAQLMTLPDKPPRRILLEFSPNQCVDAERAEILHISSLEYKSLTYPFYL